MTEVEDEKGQASGEEVEEEQATRLEELAADVVGGMDSEWDKG